MGNLDARRDWGYAPEYVHAMWMMLQQDHPDDYVVSTGTDYSVKDFIQFSFEHAGLDWEKYVKFDERYLRPTEVDSLVGSSALAEKTFGWKAQVLPKQLAQIMVNHDIAQLNGHVVDVPQIAPWV
jgi:GDPmannose 4,6-dehydratase